jgi:L-ascorbate metabolism protein UlaG (beta-lactamase superfamily)
MDTKLTYLGGSTFLIEVGSLRFLTDPGFDPYGTEKSEGPGHDLKKVMEPPVPVDEIGSIDAVFLSHAQHYDNLDISAKSMLPQWGRVFTTADSAAMLGGNAEALRTWETVELTGSAGETVRVTGMPAVHTDDPEIRGAVGETMGFLLEWDGQENGALYISGDTVWIDEIEQIASRYDVSAGILHMGAASVPAVGGRRLTMNGEEGVKVAEALSLSRVFPAHFEGWMHYQEGRDGIEQAFDAAGLTDVLSFLDPGETVSPRI